MKFLSALRLILLLKCEQSTRLVSQSLDQDLSVAERWAVRLHYGGCWSCRRFRKQIELLRQATRTGHAAHESDQLSSEARRRIEEAIRNAGMDHAG